MGDRQQLPIVSTKLHPPAVFGDIVCRKRLHSLLDKGREGPLTLVSAPAGYGKSVLVSHWAQDLDVPCGWLSLDDSDSDLVTFVRYFIAAIRSALPGAMAAMNNLITSPHLPATTLLAGHLVNDLEELESDFVLVLDDYHRVTPGSEVHDLVRFLVAHPPRGLNLVITTRTDPPLPMVALRAGRQTLEVRLRDLQFNEEEVTRFFSQRLDISISEPALANLMEQTEGWAVGLQFVALYLPQAEDPNAFLLSLKGGVQRTQEYLLHEVLAKQPAVVRECILKASLLDRFNAELLDAVCTPQGEHNQERISGREILETLNRNNLFTISLDASGHWYRYHHLFQVLLKWELTRVVSKEEIAQLNLAASEFFEAQGMISESIGYTLRAKAPERAAGIIEKHRNAKFLEDHWYEVERWLGMLPGRFRQERPELLLAEAWTLYYRLRMERMSGLIDQAEALLEKNAAPGPLQAEIGFFRGFLEYWAGDSARSEETFTTALSLLEDQESFCSSEIQVYLGLARCMNDKGEQAIQALEKLLEKCSSPGGLYYSHLIIGKVLARMVLGELPVASSEAEWLITVTKRDGLANSEAWGHYLLGCCHLAAGKLWAAVEELAHASNDRYVFDPMAVADAFVGLGLAQQMLDQGDDADLTMCSLREFAAETNDPHCLAVAESGRARLAMLRGEHEPDLTWALAVEAKPEMAELTIWLEVPAVTRARVMIASMTKNGLEKGTALLREIREVAERGRFAGQRIEVLVLLALALDLQGRSDEAMTILREAVAAAEPGGWVRPFLEAGPVMARMLQRLAETQEDGFFIQHILDVMQAPASPKSWVAQPLASRAGPAVDPDYSLEPLTNRELDVLGLLARRLRNKEIADGLCVSTHTVNFHLKQIYQKLDVHNRRQAVDRGLELGIIKLRSGN